MEIAAFAGQPRQVSITVQQQRLADEIARAIADAVNARTTGR